MKKHLTLVVLLLLTSFSAFAQDDIEYKEYSYSEFFQMIEDEEDTIFRLENAIIRYAQGIDERFLLKYDSSFNDIVPTVPNITINKELNLDNIFFDTQAPRGIIAEAGIYNFTFNESVRLRNVKNASFRYCTFNGWFGAFNMAEFAQVFDDLDDQDRDKSISLYKNQFNKGIIIQGYNNTKVLRYFIEENTIKTNKDDNNRFVLNGYSDVAIRNNRFQGDGNIRIVLYESTETEISENSFEGPVTTFELRTDLSPNLTIKKNKIAGLTMISTKSISPDQVVIDWDQFENGIYDKNSFDLWRNSYSDSLKANGQTDSLNTLNGYLRFNYLDKFKSMLPQQTDAFKNEISHLGKFYRFYKDKHDTEFANEVYIQLKNLETNRLGYLYAETPSFKTFFKWRINQFLKVFSAYGTEPERAIIFSMYVILAFALVYLFFPNHWDSHGKNRIMDRYRFFLKYVNKDSGMHEVYLEDQKQELLNAEDFKTYLLEQGKTAPKFFMATALPLYRWSVAGTKSASWLLSKVDVLKGKWSDTEPSKQNGKSLLLITAFLIALTYDIFIKMLNALMLSINTFTTLGFGEIPIKGLPRYLAIIQGFIGWFMLTIFSVSLISQLLN